MASDPSKVEGDFPVHFRYTAGIAGEKFLREIKDNGKLIASRCSKCGLNYLPPRIYCERCMSKLEEYVPVENVGTVESRTLCSLDNNGTPLPQPVNVVFVRFLSAHGGLIHRGKSDVSIGDKVQAVFKEKAERTGSILDIKHFEKTQ